MSGTSSSVKFGLMSLTVFALGCSHAAKNEAATAAAPAGAAAGNATAKPTVKETQSTVTVHTEPKKGEKKKTEKAASSGVAPSGGFICSSGSDERKLALKATPAGGCEVLYTKAGNTTSIAHADHDTSYCEKTLEKTKANLEKAGYNCTK